MQATWSHVCHLPDWPRTPSSRKRNNPVTRCGGERSSALEEKSGTQGSRWKYSQVHGVQHGNEHVPAPPVRQMFKMWGPLSLRMHNGRVYQRSDRRAEPTLEREWHFKNLPRMFNKNDRTDFVFCGKRQILYQKRHKTIHMFIFTENISQLKKTQSSISRSAALNFPMLRGTPARRAAHPEHTQLETRR